MRKSYLKLLSTQSVLGFFAGLCIIFLAVCRSPELNFDELDVFLKQNQTDAVIIIRNGKVLHEQYFAPFSASQKHDGYSIAKSFTNAAIGIALHESKIESVDSNISNFLPEYPQLEGQDLTVRHLLGMQSGIKFLNAEHYSLMMNSPDSVGYIFNLKSEANPGELWRYKADPTILSGVISRATGQSLYEYMNSKVFERLDMQVTWKSDASGLTNGNGDIFMTALDFAKFGDLFLAQGKWQGENIFAENWADVSTSPCKSDVRHNTNVWTNEPVLVAGAPPLEYGYLWWCRRLPGLPKDSYYAFGGYGQFIIITPSEKMVIVRLGRGPGQSDLVFLPKFTALVADALQLEEE